MYLFVECGTRVADIVIVIDESGSIAKPDFVKQIDFVKKVIDMFDVSATSAHVGVITFTHNAKVSLTDMRPDVR